MIFSFALLFSCWFAGEFLHRALGVPLSGPLIGMALMFVVLCLRGGPSAEFASVARGILSNLALLFVPAGVGVVAYGALLAEHWMPIMVATVAGAVLSIAGSALSMLAVERLTGVRRAAKLKQTASVPAEAPAADTAQITDPAQKKAA